MIVSRPVRFTDSMDAHRRLLEALGGHILSDDEPGKRSFQPMNVNFSLFPPLEPGTKLRPDDFEGRFRGKDKALAKKRALAARALADCRAWLGTVPETQAAE